MLILTGPTAAGKNTVGFLLAKQRQRCAVIDFGAIRGMFVQPHRKPWEGKEGKDQKLLGVKLICMLAEGFAMAGWDVIILDVLTDETVVIYRQLLGRFGLRIVQLLPTFSELERRLDERSPHWPRDQFANVYQQQCAYEHYDLRIDNTTLSPSQVAKLCADLV